MDIVIEREELLGSVLAARALLDARKDAAPISEHFKVEVVDNALRLCSVGPEMELTQTIPLGTSTSSSVENWASTLPGERFASICQSLPVGAQLRISFAEPDKKSDQEVSELSETVIECGSSRFALMPLKVSEFPSLPERKSSTVITLDWSDVHYLLSKVSSCMAIQDFRHYLNGLLLEFLPDSVRAVASDSHRLAVCNRHLENPLESVEDDQPLQLILPRKAVEKLLKFAPKKGEVTIEADQNYIAFTDAGMRFVCRLLEGPYPEYGGVIPATEQAGLMKADREGLRAAITQASSVLLSDKEQRSLSLSLKAGNLHMSASNRNQETSDVQLPVEYEGAEMQVAFRDEYLRQIIDLIDTDQVSLFFSSPEAGCLILPDEEAQTCKYLLMPLRV